MLLSVSMIFIFCYCYCTMSNVCLCCAVYAIACSINKLSPPPATVTYAHSKQTKPIYHFFFFRKPPFYAEKYWYAETFSVPKMRLKHVLGTSTLPGALCNSGKLLICSQRSHTQNWPKICIRQFFDMKRSFVWGNEGVRCSSFGRDWYSYSTRFCSNSTRISLNTMRLNASELDNIIVFCGNVHLTE